MQECPQTIYNSKWLTGFKNYRELTGDKCLKMHKTFFLCRKRAEEGQKGKGEKPKCLSWVIQVGEDWPC